MKSTTKQTSYTQDEADAIILYSNFLLNRIDQSGGTSKIDDIMDLLCDEDFTDTKEYAKLLLKEVPIKKRYDLLLELYNERSELPQQKLRYFINELLASLSKAAKEDFNRVVSKSLMKCKDDNDLRMYCHYFMEDTYLNIDKLARLRIEDLMLKSVKSGQLVRKIDSVTKKETLSCPNGEGSLGTWIDDRIHLLGNRKEIIAALFRDADRGGAYQEYVFHYFGDVLFAEIDFLPWQIDLINRKLRAGNEYFYNAILEKIEGEENERCIELFGEAYAECEKKIENGEPEEELPF